MVVKLLKILTVPLDGDKLSASHTVAVSSTERRCLVVKVKFQCSHRTSIALVSSRLTCTISYLDSNLGHRSDWDFCDFIQPVSFVFPYPI